MASSSSSPTESAKRAPYRVLSGYCPDSQCGTKLYFPAWDSSIECSNCGKRYEQKALLNVEQVCVEFQFTVIAAASVQIQLHVTSQIYTLILVCPETTCAKMF